MTETDRANDALALIGEPRIMTLDDAKRRAARECKARFAFVRDALLRICPWQFARASARPASIGAAPNGLYAFRYAMPDDLVTVLSVTGLANEEWQVQARDGDDDATVYVDTDIEDPLIVYTRRVANPAQWDELFSEVFVLRLAAAVNPALGRDKTLTQQLEANAEHRLAKAMQRDGRERSAQYVTNSTSWVAARGGMWRR